MIQIALFIFIATAIIINAPTAIIASIVFLIFSEIVKIVNDKQQYKNSDRIYGIVYSANIIYMLLCFMFMKGHGYEYLLAFDTIDVFIPRTEDFLCSADSFKGIMNEVWGTYSLLDRFQVGYYSILVSMGYIAKSVNADFYFLLQLGGMAFSSLTSVYIYKILRENDIDEKKALKYSIIVSLCSILFYYNSLILRDGIIAMLFVYIMYLCHKDFSPLILTKILLSCILMITFRAETGLASFLFIATFFIFKKKTLNIKTVISVICSIIPIVYLTSIVLQNASIISELYSNNYDFYMEDVEEGSGVIGALQRIPFPIGDILSIIYTFLTPIPCWAKLTPSLFYMDRPECYNIMNFPIMIASLYNTLTLSSLYFFIIQKNRPKLSSTIKFLLFPVIVIMLIQASVVTQRRVMGLYALIYIISIIYMSNTDQKTKKKIITLTLFLFTSLQIIGLLFF